MQNTEHTPPHSRPAFALGRQLTLEYYDCAAEALLDKEDVEKALVSAAEQSGATIISTSFHRFDPQGISGVVIIAESHFTIHAWPEHNYAAVDIFTCADNINLDIAVDAMQTAFGAKEVLISSDLNRGLLARPAGSGNIVSNSLPGQRPQSRPTIPITWKKTWEEMAPQGMTAAVDLYGCDPDDLQDPEIIRGFAAGFCQRFGIEPKGSCQVRTGDRGSTDTVLDMTQETESGVISGRFVASSGTAYLDLFSQVFYEPREAAEFSLGFFRAAHYKLQTALRQ